MRLHHRNLHPLCQKIYCDPSPLLLPPPPPPPPPPPSYKYVEDRTYEIHSKHSKISTYLIVSFALVATAFFLLCCYAIYAKFFSGWRSRRSSFSRQQTLEEGFDDDGDDEEHGPVVDHPIWYIRTTGLQQSVIGAITVCKYKRDEGLIEGTECSVCLSEFQEDENLRLLPKCNHAFHLPCIDTWLTSHTNCPLCRAPILINPATLPSMDPSTSLENSQIQVLEHGGGEARGGMENSSHQIRNGEEEEGEQVEERRRVCETAQSLDSEVVNMQQHRRSVSLDSSAAANINLALATIVSVESRGNSKRVPGNRSFSAAAKTASSSSSFRTRYLHTEPTSMKRSRSFNAKQLLSWHSRSQRKPNAPLRSF